MWYYISLKLKYNCNVVDSMKGKGNFGVIWEFFCNAVSSDELISTEHSRKDTYELIKILDVEEIIIKNKTYVVKEQSVNI